MGSDNKVLAGARAVTHQQTAPYTNMTVLCCYLCFSHWNWNARLLGVVRTSVKGNLSTFSCIIWCFISEIHEIYRKMNADGPGHIADRNYERMILFTPIRHWVSDNMRFCPLKTPYSIFIPTVWSYFNHVVCNGAPPPPNIAWYVSHRIWTN